MSDEVVPQNVWLTTNEVKKRYGFDPVPFIERTSKHYIRNQIQMIRGCGECLLGYIRLWIEEDVKYQSEDLKKVPAPASVETIKQRCEREAQEGLARK